MTTPRGLVEAIGLAEIGPHIAEISVLVESSLVGPFAVGVDRIMVREDVAAEVADAAVTLREAIELRYLGGTSGRWVHRILAHATAAVYQHTTLRTVDVLAGTRGLTAPGVGAALRDRSACDRTVVDEISRFLRARDGLDPCPAADQEAACRALDLAVPTEVLLTMGGDHRQRIDWTRGTNAYGLPTSPAPWMPQLGSCTACAPSERAFAAAERTRRQLLVAAVEDRGASALDAQADSIRRAVLSAVGLGGSTDVAVILTPSGTDAELVALALAQVGAERVRTIVVAPQEIGSGSPDAAAGRHFSVLTPLGAAPVTQGALVGGFDATRLEVVTVAVRDPDGGVRAIDEVEADVERHIRTAGCRVVVHVVDGSKTGVRTTRRSTACRWARQWPEVRVVVDAAQMRLDQHSVADHIDCGHLVFVTGSKFFGGPSFSGAVLVPPTLTPVAAELTSGPPGLADYLSQYDVPASLPGLRSLCAGTPNVGLIARWSAAVSEIRAFSSVPPEIRADILRRLAAGIRSCIDEAPLLSLVENHAPGASGEDNRGVDGIPTYFAFLLRGPDGVPLDVDSARVVHGMALEVLGAEGSDDSASTPDGWPRRSVFLGQPVGIPQPSGQPAGALRIAVSAPMVSRVAFDTTRGRTWETRIAAELADIRGAFCEVTAILSSWRRGRSSADARAGA
jgi:hypothetical protein